MIYRANKRADGFTLLELIAVIVILSVAAVPISGLFSKASLSMLNNQRIQIATQLAQEQAELILGRRRNQGFAAIALTYPVEALTGNYAGFNRTTNVTQATGLPAACPTGIVCNEVTISVDAGGPVLSELTFVLVNY